MNRNTNETERYINAINNIGKVNGIIRTVIFRRFLVVEVAGRLTPFNAETPKSGEKTRFRAGSDFSIHLMYDDYINLGYVVPLLGGIFG